MMPLPPDVVADYYEREPLGMLERELWIGWYLPLVKHFGRDVGADDITKLRRWQLLAIPGIGRGAVWAIEDMLSRHGLCLRPAPGKTRQTRSEPPPSRIDTPYDWEFPRDDPAHVSLRGLTAAIHDSGIDLDHCQLACALDTQPEAAPPAILWRVPWREEPMPPTCKQIGRARKILDRAGYDVVRREL